jgi:hypothetical protein
MRIVDEHQKAAILELVTYPGSPSPARDAEQRVLEAFNASDGQLLAVDLVSQGLDNQDSDTVGFGLIVAFHFGPDPQLRPLLHKLVRPAWHRSHEDLTVLLEELGGPDSVEDLTFLAWADGPHLAYAGDTALARKATHGLERIATPDAVEAIETLRAHPAQEVRDLAARIISRQGRPRG